MSPVTGPEIATDARLKPDPYRLQCVVHRESASGIIIHDEQILAPSEAKAVADAKARFAQLLAGRSGSAALRDTAGRVVWSRRQNTPSGAGAPEAES